MSDVKNIAIVGGSGQMGSLILSALLDSPKGFNVTAITRAESNADFPSSVTVKKGDYADDSFFVSALQNIDALVMALSLTTPKDLQSRLIAAAAKAGVAFVIPNEYGSDNDHPNMREGIPVNAHKTRYREEVEILGVSSWMSIVNNPWFDFSLSGGWFGIDIQARKATLYDDGTVKFNTTTRPTVGLAVARLLALPRATLDEYKNKFVYISSFRVNQRELLASVQKATGTTDADWTVEHKSAQKYLDESNEKFKSGDFMGGVRGLVYSHHLKEGLGGDFQMTGRKVANELLELPVENLDEATALVVKGMKQ